MQISVIHLGLSTLVLSCLVHWGQHSVSLEHLGLRLPYLIGNVQNACIHLAVQKSYVRIHYANLPMLTLFPVFLWCHTAILIRRLLSTCSSMGMHISCGGKSSLVFSECSFDDGVHGTHTYLTVRPVLGNIENDSVFSYLIKIRIEWSHANRSLHLQLHTSVFQQEPGRVSSVVRD